VRFVLLHTPTWDAAIIREALQSEQIEIRPVVSLADPGLDERPTVFVLDPDARESVSGPMLGALADAGVSILALGKPGEDDVPITMPSEALSGFLKAPAGPRQLLVSIRGAFRISVARREAARSRADSAARTSEITDLTEIGIRLTTEKDYNTLLDLILNQARRITQSDAGSLYLVETDDGGRRRLRFKLSQNDSRPDIPFVEFTIPIDHTSLAGYAAFEAEPLVIEDVYMLPPDVAYSFNRSFDGRYGYRTKSMLVIPMQNHDGDVIGVLQLLNRKRDQAARIATPADAERLLISYSPHSVKIVRAMAGQAAVSLENSQLYESIERLFEGFVRAAVTAIEQRDPTTSGHSERVASRTVALAAAVDRTSAGPYASVNFSREQLRELQYAGLLHDFGKVGVREQVLVKAKKLYDGDLAQIRARQAFIRRSAQWRFERERADYLVRHGKEKYEEFLRDLEDRHTAEIATADRFLRVVLECNEPSVLAAGSFELLQEFAGQCYEDIDGIPQPFLSQSEVKFLSIRKGSLDERERLEIESHVTHTFGFLRRIPWTRELSRIPDIAHGHHEKLNGKGYPLGISGAEIPIQTRMMTIADIFDALTAHDRPYKRAIPVPKALDIMSDEVTGGMLDRQLFDLFVEAKVFETS
jgi:HD-GYP domain-containing protein (c-di-GMP phosphodiesterase class II)